LFLRSELYEIYPRRHIPCNWPHQGWSYGPCCPHHGGFRWHRSRHCPLICQSGCFMYRSKLHRPLPQKYWNHPPSGCKGGKSISNIVNHYPQSSDEATYWKTFEINVRGTYRATKAFPPLILSSKNGLKTVVNLSSVAAHNIRPDSSAYGISKFAFLGFTEFLAAENEDLVAFCVHPGAIMSKLAEAMPKKLQAGEHLS